MNHPDRNTADCQAIRPLLFAALENQIDTDDRVHLNAHLAACEPCRSFERAERALTDLLDCDASRVCATTRGFRRGLARIAGPIAAAALIALALLILPAATPRGSIIERHLETSTDLSRSESAVESSNHVAVPRSGAIEIELSRGVRLEAAGPARFELDQIGSGWKIVILEGRVRATLSEAGALVVVNRAGRSALAAGSHPLTLDGVEGDPGHQDPARGERAVAASIADGQELFYRSSVIEALQSGPQEQANMAAAEKLFLRALADSRITTSERNTAMFYLMCSQSRQRRYADSIATSQKWLGLFPADPSRDYVRFCLAADHEKLGHYDDAMRIWREIVEQSPPSSMAANAQAYLDTAHERQEQDPVRGRRTVAAIVADGQELFGRSSTLELLFADPNEQANMAAAEKLFVRALADPRITAGERNSALFYLMCTQSRQHRYADSIASCEKWLDLFPPDSRRDYVRFCLAADHERLGHYDDAMRIWREIVEQTPPSSMAASAQAYLDTAHKRRGRAGPGEDTGREERDQRAPALGAARTTRVRPDRSKAGPYLVVAVDLGTADAGFRAAAAAAASHHGAEVLQWDGRDWTGLTQTLVRHRPENVLFVLRPETLDINLHRQILLRSAALDDDPFVDFAFGYLTASSGDAAIALWQRIERLHQRGLASRQWIGSSITSSQQSLEYQGSLPPIAKRAGFDGAHYYPSIHDPEQSAFVDRVLGELSGASVIQFTGNGDPQGIWLFDDHRNVDRGKHWAYAPDRVGHDPDGEMPRIMADQFRATRLDSPIIWSGTCHSAATCRVFVEGDIVSTFGRTEVDTVHRLAPRNSLALAWLDAGCAALLAPIAANHGMSVSMETDFVLRHGASLGEAVKSTWDDVFLAADGPLRLDIAEPGTPQGRDGYVMQGGGANRILIGDPALSPFARTDSPSEAVSVERSEGGFTVTIDRKEGFEPRAWDIFGTDRSADWRAITRVELTDLVPEGRDLTLSAVVRATDPSGTVMPFRLSRCSAEDYHGRRYLHLQANAPRADVQGKPVRVRFDVTVR